MAKAPAETAPGTDRNKVWYLQRNRLFVGAVDDPIEKNEHIFTIVAYPHRTLIFDQGDSARVVYFIKKGAVRIARVTEDGKEVTVAVLGPGDLFGEEMIFASAPHDRRRCNR
jgi:CRP/FNR family transcriptional regulator, cyclic AMP receptor protein